MTDRSKKDELKLDEMKFQYQLIENNYSRLIDKCSFSMLVLCVILGVIVRDATDSLSCLGQVILAIAIICSIISLCFLFWILVGKKQPVSFDTNRWWEITVTMI